MRAAGTEVRAKECCVFIGGLLERTDYASERAASLAEALVYGSIGTAPQQIGCRPSGRVGVSAKVQDASCAPKPSTSSHEPRTAM